MAFALGGSLLLLDGSMGPVALTSAFVSLLLDLDSLLSPDQAHERLFHSSYLPLALLPLVRRLGIRPVFRPLPASWPSPPASPTWSLDILRGEPMHPRDPLLRKLHLPSSNARERPM